jgi:hypothetical protein
MFRKNLLASLFKVLRWIQQDPPKRWYQSTRRHDITPHETVESQITSILFAPPAQTAVCAVLFVTQWSL